jgi:hypothetical protein
VELGITSPVASDRTGHLEHTKKTEGKKQTEDSEQTKIIEMNSD